MNQPPGSLDPSASSTVRNVNGRGLVPLILVIVSTLLSMWFFNRWAWCDFRVPVNYSGDSVAFIANTIGFSEGASHWGGEVSRLNAPYKANWHEYPITETLIYSVYTLAIRFFPPGAAQNTMIWLAMVSAVLGFYAAARWTGAQRLASAVTALLFGFSHYLTFRASGHMNLAFIWHLPLMFALVHRMFSPEPLTSRTWLAAAGLAMVSAVQNPYYGFFFGYLMGISFLFLLLRGSWRRALLGLAAAALWLFLFVVNLAGHFASIRIRGPNPLAVQRSLYDLEDWGLRLPDLLWPASHPLPAWTRLAASGYFGGGIRVDEHASGFLGIAGLIALALLIIHSVIQLVRQRPGRVTGEAWCGLFAFVYGVQGGINLVLGSLGFVLLRGTNRYSILILCASLLFLARVILPKLRFRWIVTACAALLLIQVWELHASPRRHVGGGIDVVRAQVESDQDFGARLESALPAGSMIFQLPVWDYPEGGYRHLMRDYEHFRPFIWTRTMHFSYGSCKGRTREGWQKETGELPVEEMISRLQAFGFSAIFINRQAYPDQAASFEAELAAAGLERLVESRRGDMVTYRLHPVAPAMLPEAKPAVNFGRGFYVPLRGPGTETSRLSSGNARIMVERGDAVDMPVEISALLHSPRRQTLSIMADGTTWWSDTLMAGESRLVRWVFTPEQPVTTFDITTDTTPAAVQATGGYIVGFGVDSMACRMLTGEVEPGTGFYGWEPWGEDRTLAWSYLSAGAELLVAPDTNDTPRILAFNLGTPRDCDAEIQVDGTTAWRGRVRAMTETRIELEVPRSDRRTHVALITDAEPRPAGSNDTRTLAFAIGDISLSPRQQMAY